MSEAEVEYWAGEAQYEATGTSGHASPALASVAYPVSVATPIASPGAEHAAGARGAYGRYLKRTTDIVISSALLVLAAPVILGLGLIVSLGSGWPVFHKTKRIGLNGQEFTMWKLRTMVRDAEKLLDEWRVSNPQLAEAYFTDYKLKDDPRITSVGRFLRKSSLDELPQLWNVLRGDMSLVGPRPIVRDELRNYGSNVGDFLAVRPGITGLWQTDGRNDVLYPERSWFELTYCRTYTWSMDVKILLKTLATPLRFNG